MKKTIFGLDLNRKIKPKMIRDAIITCFSEAHCDNPAINLEDDSINEVYCKEIVRKAFQDSGGNFNNPSKDDLINAIDNLANFSKNFRDPKIIEKHFNQIMRLIKKIH